MGKTLEKVHATCAGRVTHVDKIPQWLRANGGQYSKEINEKVTHLITTQDAYENDVASVQTAKSLGTIKIVSYEWLEDSLMSTSRAPKREGPYLWKNILKAEKGKSKVNRANTGKKQAAKVTKKRSPAKSKVNIAGYHIYSSIDTGATFDITLARYLPSTVSKEKFHLELYESDKVPHVYTAQAKYSRKGKSTTEILAPCGSTVDIALAAFEQFFEDKSGKRWEDRLDGKAPTGKRDDNDDLVAPHEGWFHWENMPSLISSFLRQGPETAVDNNNSSEQPYSTPKTCEEVTDK